MVHMGDGDAGIITRLYIDGTLAEEVAGNLFAIILLSFTSSLRICTYSATAVTAYCSETRVSGFRRSAGSKSQGSEKNGDKARSG